MGSSDVREAPVEKSTGFLEGQGVSDPKWSMCSLASPTLRGSLFPSSWSEKGIETYLETLNSSSTVISWPNFLGATLCCLHGWGSLIPDHCPHLFTGPLLSFPVTWTFRWYFLCRCSRRWTPKLTMELPVGWQDTLSIGRSTCLKWTSEVCWKYSFVLQNSGCFPHLKLRQKTSSRSWSFTSSGAELLFLW